MTTTRLRADEIAHHLDRLRSHSSLTTLQAARLDAIVQVLGADGRFLLRDALEAAEFPAGDARGQDAFQDFRRRVNQAAVDARVDLQLELDSRKAPPDRRHGWFTGGDLIDEGIASFTGAAADRTGIAHPVDPEVAELVGTARTRVYVSVDPPSGTVRRKLDALLLALRESLALDPERDWEIADPASVGLGEDPDVTRDRLAAQADVRVALVSPSYLAGEERRRALDTAGRTVVFAFSSLPDGPLDLGSLHRHDVHRRADPWDELSRTDQRRRYVAELVDAVRRALRRPSTPAGRAADDPFVSWSTSKARSRRPGDSAVLVEPEGAETSLRESRLDGSEPAAGPAQPAVARLVAWATAVNGPPLCALLGDVGMGKTTTAKLFTQHLLQMRSDGAPCPLPILFDLRDVRVTALMDAINLDDVLDGMLDATRPPGIPRDRLNADAVRRRLSQGDAVIVFDGLDEVLVHLHPHDQQMFARQLWRALDDGSGARMLMTCRTQYFRTIRDEITYFTGEDRQGLRGDDYLALLMLPFREEQVREYLAANVNRDGDWVDGFLETVAAVHDLTDLARRPLTLRLIADQVEFIERAKLEGRALRSVDLYGEVVERWLSRDSGKHTLTPEHKRLLMEEIAAGLWRSGRNSWGAAEVDDWLLDLLDRRPDLQRHYRERVPDLWKADFRTATFLARDRENDTFEFGHRSLFEYFLARYLFRMLVEVGSSAGGDLDVLAMPVPGQETLEFLGQSIAGVTGTARDAALAGLGRTRDAYVPQVSELALAYALHGAGRGHPHHSLVGVKLPGADLDGWRLGVPDGPLLTMTGADLRGASLRGTRFHRVDLSRSDLSGTDLTGAELHGSRLASAAVDGAELTGTILRECEIGGVRLGRTRRYRTEILRCVPVPEPLSGVLVAPLPQDSYTGAPVLRLITGPTTATWSAAWSANGSRIAVGGYGGAWTWDVVTGKPLHHLVGRAEQVTAVAWSPDETRVLVGGARGGIRIVDAVTGTALQSFEAHREKVAAAAWSPDGTRILTIGDGRVRVRDATTGAVLHDITGEAEPIQLADWSPDGTRVAVIGHHTVAIRDASTGAVVRDLTGHDLCDSVSWSPDGCSILTIGDGIVRVQDLTTGSVLQTLGSRPYRITSGAWLDLGTRIIAVDDGGGIGIWDATTGAVLERQSTALVPAGRGMWSPDRTRLLSVGGGVTAEIWDTTTGERLHRLAAHQNWVQAVAWSPDNTRTVAAGEDGTARIWDVPSGEMLHQITAHVGSVRSASWSNDLTRLLTTGDDGTARIWDARSGELLHRLTAHSGEASSGVWSQGDDRLLTGGGDGTIGDWDAAAGTLLNRLRVERVTTAPGDTDLPPMSDEPANGDVSEDDVFYDGLDFADIVESVAWSPDHTRILAGGAFGAHVLDLDGSVVHDLADDTASVNQVAWSPDGARLAAGGNDGVRVWDAADGTLRTHLTGRAGTVLSLEWHSKSTHIITGDHLGVVTVWDVATGYPVHRIDAHDEWVRSVAWSPDGSRLLSGGDDGMVKTWNAVTGEPTGFVFASLPDKEVAVFDAVTEELVGASPGAWRWLGWNVVEDGRMTRLPAETFGPLPPLPGTSRTVTDLGTPVD